MNKPHIELLPKDDRFLSLVWVCSYKVSEGVYIGYGRTPVEAYRDYSLKDNFNIFDVVMED